MKPQKSRYFHILTETKKIYNYFDAALVPLRRILHPERFGKSKISSTFGPNFVTQNLNNIKSDAILKESFQEAPISV